MADEDHAPARGPDAYERLLKETHSRKAKIKEQAAEIERLGSELAAATGERDRLRADVAKLKASPDEMQARIAELEKSIVVRDRTEQWNKLAKDAGVADGHLDDLRRLTGIDLGADDYDAGGAEQGIADAVRRLPSLQGSPGGGPSKAGGAGVARGPGPGFGRGSAPSYSDSHGDQRASGKSYDGRLS
jgi:hypothetical protein